MNPAGESGALSGRQPKAVRNALALVEEVIAAGPGVTAKELSTALKLPSSTTYRLLNLLVAEEYLVRLPDLRGFALGRRAARLSVPITPQLPTAARAVLDHLRGLVRWGVHLATYTPGHLALLDADPDHPPTEEAILARYPHASALGKLLLAEHTDWQPIAGELRRFTEHTITDPAELETDLTKTARCGQAQQCAELRPDRGCLAVPIRAPANGELVAGLALCGAPARVADPDPKLIGLLHEHGDRLAPLLA
jgi:DNA-binding IclR family transcriptional regulator